MAHEKSFLVCENKCLVPSEQVQIVAGFTIATNEWSGSSYTRDIPEIRDVNSICDVYISNDSLTVFEKAKIKGRCEAGKLILTYGKAPTGNIVIDCVKVVG